MDEIPVQKRDHFFIRALLGRKDCRRALRAVHRVVDVAHGSDGAAGKKALSFCRIVGHDLFERVSGRHKAFALLVIELRSERCGSAAPASLVQLPPRPMMMFLQPCSTASRIRLPTPKVVVFAGFLCSPTIGSPAACAISMNAVPSLTQ